MKYVMGRNYGDWNIQILKVCRTTIGFGECLRNLDNQRVTSLLMY